MLSCYRVAARLPCCVVGSYMTPMSTVAGRFTGSMVSQLGLVSLRAESPVCSHSLSFP